MKPRVIVILGPTASGKSTLAVEIAQKINGEIISADSRQVYTGLDIGTGKITKKEMQGIPHYLLDVVSPKKKFTVTEFQEKAISAIAEIIKKGKTPIICGGTGFYIDAITKGTVFPEVPPNPKLRKELERKSIAELTKMLTILDPVRAKNIDVQNKVRLVRAIEIAKTLGSIPKIKNKKPPYTFIKIGLTVPPDILAEKIKSRLLSRMKSGMLKEATLLHKNGLSWKRMNELGLEYRFLAEFLQKKISMEEMLAGLNTAINQYAKRQMTWFKRDKDITWIDMSTPYSVDDLLRLL